MHRRAAAVITAGFLTISIAYAIRYGYGLFLPAMIPSLGISKTEAGMIAAAYFVAYTLFSPLLGLLADRYDIRYILSFFTALLGGGAFCMAFSTSAFSAALFFALAGIGHSACWAPVMSLVLRWVPDRRRGMALAATTAGSSLGIAAWSLALPPLIGTHGWQSGWMAMGLFGMCIAVVNWFLVRNPSPAVGPYPQSNPDAPAASLPGKGYGRLLREKGLWLIGMAYLLVGFTALVPYTFLGVYAVDHLGMSYGTAGNFLAMIALAGFAGKMIFGILSDAYGRLPVMIACGALLGIGCLGMALCRGLAGMSLFIILFGLGWGAVWPVYAAAAPDYFTKARSGSVIGIWTVFLGVGSILSPVVCGWTIDVTGSYDYTFVLGFAAGFGSSLLLLPVFTLPRPKID